MADKFPLELVRKIIANLDDYHDKDTLKAAALAGSLLRGLCQEQLFSSIHAVGHTERGSETRCLRLLKLFHKSPVLATYVRTVHIHAHDAGWVEDDFLPKLLIYLADVGLVTRFYVGVMDFQWVKPPVEVQEAITRLMLSPSIKSVSIEGVPIDHLDLGNPSVKEVTLLSAMDHPKRSIFRSIHSESGKKAEPLQLMISQSEPLVSALMKPESGISWSSLRELTLKLDLLHGSSHIPELNAMLTAVGPTLGFFQFEAELLRNPNQIIDLSMLTNLRCLGILHSASLSKMLGMGMGTRQLQNPFLESLQFLLETACTDHLRTIGICTGAALRAMPNGPAQTPSWDLDLEINRHKAWASLIKMITNKDRFPCMKEFVVMGFGVEESIRKHLPQIDATGMLMVDTKNAPPPPMAGFQFVSVGPGQHGGPPGGPHGAPGHGPAPDHGPAFGYGTAPGHGHGDDEDDDYDPHHGHGHSHGHGGHGHSHDHGHGGHGHSHDQPGGGGYHTHDLGHFYFGGPGQNFQDYGGESHYGHSLDSLN